MILQTEVPATRKTSILMPNGPEHLCHACVKDPFLKAEIKSQGEKVACARCGKVRKAMRLTTLARRIDEAIHEHFEPSRNDFGSGWSEVAQEQTGIDRNIIADMQQWLSNTRGYESRKGGEEDVYDGSIIFEERTLDRDIYRRRWDDFKRSVKQEARYFNRQADEYLGDIFTGIEGHASWRGDAVIVKWQPNDGRQLVRGRVAQDDKDLQTYLSNPSKEVGPPPQGTASGGRMNAAGVSAFYGALDEITCRSEVRPPVGSHVVFARFEVLRALRILDMDALARIIVDGSIFDPDYAVRLARVAFLRNFGAEIARPVMPRDETFGYLPTQIVADFIAQRLGLDGILFRSVQAGSRTNDDGSFPQNVFLFNQSARVEEVDVTDLKFDVDLGWFDEDEQDGDDGITVSTEELRSRSRRKATQLAVPCNGIAPTLSADSRPITLRYIPNSATVEYIRGVEYDGDKRHINYSHTSVGEARRQKRHWARVGFGRRTGISSSPDFDPDFPF